MINCEWGIEGINKFSLHSEVTIIVDILSFSTCVDIALSRKAFVYPYKFKDNSAIEYAKAINAELAQYNRSRDKISLSPLSLKKLSEGKRIVLPSPNGSELSLSSKSRVTMCACLRNYRVVAEYVNSISKSVVVVPAGEKWQNSTIRFAIEDYLGAGALLSELKGELSAEAKAAKNLFVALKPDLRRIISGSLSGKELIEKGFPEDVDLALESNKGKTIPILAGNFYTNSSF
ncbi:MAG: 2-phosphosulfolactate phosphatase [Ignavibacteria bacterium]|nr:2-phosphosulfolactate phosphatase [Ignavibacteria bacterium]